MAKIEIEDTELAELRKAAKDAEKALARAEALAGQLTEAQKGTTRLAELEEQAKGWAAERLDTTFKAAGISDPKIRKVFNLEFEEQATVDGGEKDLGKWLEGLTALPADKRPAHLAPFLPKPGVGGNDASKRSPANLPDPNKNTGPAAGSDPPYTAEAVEQMTADEFRAHIPALTKVVPQLAGVQIPGQKAASP